MTGRSDERGRTGRAVAGLAIAAVLALLGAVLPALAGPVGTAAGFEDDDGNLVPEAPINFDWNSFAPTTWTGTAPNETSTKTVSGWAFTGSRTRRPRTATAPSPAARSRTTTVRPSIAKAPNKDDLKRVYVASNTVGGDVFLNLAWVRIPQNTTSPSAHIGFEFNQSDPTAVRQLGRPGPPHGRRHADRLRLRGRRHRHADDHAPALGRHRACEVGSNSPPCWGVPDLTALGFAEAKVNTSASVARHDRAVAARETSGPTSSARPGINLTDAGVFTSKRVHRLRQGVRGEPHLGQLVDGADEGPRRPG